MCMNSGCPYAIPHVASNHDPHTRTLLLRNVRLSGTPDDASAVGRLYNVTCVDGKVAHVAETDSSANENLQRNGDVDQGEDIAQMLDAKGLGILLPGLCHAHIHLDKCYLLSQCDDLQTGDFAEALSVTAKAKTAFPSRLKDLYDRGKRLVIESVQCGVTAMRAHVEVDKTVHMCCLDTGLKLKDDFRAICDVQICVFAQDPLFPREADQHPGENYSLLREAAAREGVQAVGSAPYVEPTTNQARRNIDLILQIAYEQKLHADFHLDYNLDASTEPFIWYLLQQVRQRKKAGKWHDGAQVCVGHATRLSLFSPEEWARFYAMVECDKLPVTLVGLPPSDMYMMGRALPGLPRATLNVPKLAKQYGVSVGMAVNNVENAFTPQGVIDPLALCPLGVAVFQDGTNKGCRTLIEAVTITARVAIGARGPTSLTLTPGDTADFVLLHENDSVSSVTLNPSYARTVIKDGQIVAARRVNKWIRLV